MCVFLLSQEVQQTETQDGKVKQFNLSTFYSPMSASLCHMHNLLQKCLIISENLELTLILKK